MVTKEELKQQLDAACNTSETVNAPRIKKKKDSDTIEKSFFVDDQYIYEQIFDKVHKFCRCDRKTKEISYVYEINSEEGLIVPIPGEEVEKLVILLPKRAKAYNSVAELDAKIEAHIFKWLDVDPTYRRFATWNIRFSWLYDKFNTLNYTRALGDTGVGKSRFLNVLGDISYKPMKIAGALTSAPIFRIINKWKGTLCIDECDQKDSDEANAFIKIMNCGYERGMSIVRCDRDDPNKLNFFDVFCPKVVTTRTRFMDKATESRCMTKIMTQTSRKDIPDILTKKYEKEAEELREMLLYYRLQNYDIVDSEAGMDIDLSMYEPRLRQVNRSFLGLFCHDPKEVERFKEYLTEYQKEIIEERSESYEGGIVNAIANLVANAHPQITPTKIAEYINENIGGRYEAKAKGVASKARGLGFLFKREKIFGKTENHLYLKTKESLERFASIIERYVTDDDLLMRLRKGDGVTTVTNVTGRRDLIISTGDSGIMPESDNIKIIQTEIGGQYPQNRNLRNCETFSENKDENFSVTEKMPENPIVTTVTAKNQKTKDEIYKMIEKYQKTAPKGYPIEKLKKDAGISEDDLEFLLMTSYDFLQSSPGFIQVI